MTPFAAALRAQRQRLGLTQTQLGSLLPDDTGKPLPLRTVQDWEGGQRQPPGYAKRLILRVLAAVTPKAR